MPKVLCIGVWDLMHKGHYKLLEEAAKMGDLTVCVVCDSAVRLQKGENRPVINEFDRMYMISRIQGVKNVELIWGFYFPKHLIEESNFIIVGADQTHLLNLHEIPKNKRIDLPRTEGVSTSDIIGKIKQEVYDALMPKKDHAP